MATRKTASMRSTDGQLLDTKTAYQMVKTLIDGPAEGDRVQLSYDGNTVEGTWEPVDADTEPGTAVRTDDGQLHHYAPGKALQVLRQADHPRLPLLTYNEAIAVTLLLDELDAIYDGEPLARGARELSVRLWDRMGI